MITWRDKVAYVAPIRGGVGGRASGVLANPRGRA